MTERWVNHDKAGTGDAFHTLHTGLTVELISTKRSQLMTCALDETLSALMGRNTERYDFLPVVDSGDGKQNQIVGLFCATEFFDQAPGEECIDKYYKPLSEEYLIGADASILEFVVDADEKPCRLVISGASIVGLVSLADLQKLPVRAALFALITGLEISMFKAIKKAFPTNDCWKRHLSVGRRTKIDERVTQSHKSNGFVDALLFTQFCDKAEIILKFFPLPQSKRAIRYQIETIQALRDNLAHANEYAASPDEARQVCAVVRNILTLRAEIRTVGRGNSDAA